MAATPASSPARRRPTSPCPTPTARPVRLSDLRGRKVVLYVYPAASTPGCTTQACDFRDSLSSLQAAGYEVLGLSPDPPEKLARFREQGVADLPAAVGPVASRS